MSEFHAKVVELAALTVKLHAKGNIDVSFSWRLLQRAIAGATGDEESTRFLLNQLRKTTSLDSLDFTINQPLVVDYLPSIEAQIVYLKTLMPLEANDAYPKIAMS